MAVINGRLSFREAAASSHRVTGDRRDGIKGIGAEFLHIAIDHHSRLAFTAMYPDQTEAYAQTYQNSEERTAALISFTHQYNWHRPHASLNQKPPISRSRIDDNNLLTHHSRRLKVLPQPAKETPTTETAATQLRPHRSGLPDAGVPDAGPGARSLQVLLSSADGGPEARAGAGRWRR